MVGHLAPSRIGLLSAARSTPTVAQRSDLVQISAGAAALTGFRCGLRVVVRELHGKVTKAAQTLATFAIFNLAGLHFSPRIRDIGRLQLYRLGTGSAWRGRYPHAGPLLGQPIQTQLIADHWNDL